MSAKEYISDHVLARYLAGAADAEEVAEVNSWLKADPSRERELAAYRKIWEKSRFSEQPDRQVDTDKAWTKVKQRMYAAETTSVQPLRRTYQINYWNAAAVFLVALTLGWLVFKPAPEPVLLTFSSGNSMKQVDLPDGSKVFLNHHSSISYADGLKGSTRSVSLKGEAFFDVSRDADRPFVVAAGDVDIKVLGTSFNVKAYGAYPLRVDVKEGKVQVAKLTRKVVLAKGQSARIGEDDELTTISYDENEMAYHTGIYDFRANTLGEVVDALNRGFHADISLSGKELTACHYTARFEGQSLDAILHIIAESLNLNIRKTAGGYILTGSGCH